MDVYDLELQHLRRIDGVLLEVFVKTNSIVVEEKGKRVLWKFGGEFATEVLEGKTRVVETTKERLAFIEVIVEDNDE